MSVKPDVASYLSGNLAESRSADIYSVSYALRVYDCVYGIGKDKLTAYTEILYAQARLISGLEIKDPVKLSSQICDLMV